MSDRLIRLRDRAHNQIISIKKFADMITDATDLDDITKRIEVLEAKYNDFNELEVQLFDDTTYQPITDVVDDLYFKTYAVLNKANRNRIEPSITPDLNATLGQFIDQQKTFYEGVNMSQHVRLPKLNIETFSGDYKYWASFHDLFTTTVHDNQNLSGVHKLQMLKGVLSGEAASLIRHIPVTETNYIEAWEKLCNRYNKKNPIITSLINTFFEQKACAQANAKELRHLTETSDEIIRGLRALGPSAETRDPWILHVLISKLDHETKQLWANESVGEDFPTFNTLLQFLNKRCDALEICGPTNKTFKPKSTAKSFFVSKKDMQLKCIICSQAHLLFRCPVFKNQSVEARLRQAINLSLCQNCLKQGHTSEKCFSKFSCLICNKRHHSLLHPAQPDLNLNNCNQSVTSHHTSLNETAATTSQLPSTSTQQSNTTIATSNSQSNTVLHTLFASPTTVLPTAIVYAKTSTGKLQSFRALLDSGSQTSFVTESCAQCLGLKRTQASISIYGLASSSAGQTKGKINMTIHSKVDPTYHINVTAHIIGNITNLLPTKPVRLQSRIEGIELADPQFFNPSKIDILLGADVFFEVLTSKQRRINGYPVLQSSKLGWLIAGNFNNSNSSVINLHCAAEPVIQTTNDDIYKLLTKFWEVEETEPQNSTVPCNSCEEYYSQTTTHHSDGRFMVKLPFKTPRPLLGSSFEAAHHRLLAMERKFARAPEFFDDYKAFIHEYHSLGHMTRLTSNEVPIFDNDRYFLPHHAVVKASSSTTKLRVVFDASCKTSSHVSLNDILQIGPNIQTDLSTILIKFRKHAVALVADIEKMYRQIWVNPDDANYQLILWRDNSKEPVSVYKLNTVTYGTASAPFLAVKSLKSSTERYDAVYPKATQVIKNDFYIDDLLTGCDNVAEAVVLKQQITEILDKSGFNLRKWKSNSSEFLKSFPTQEVQSIPKLIEDDITIKTLGIIWNSDTDTFSFKVTQSSDSIVWTKRKILSTASKIYDPLGWLAPTTVLFKMLLQKMWLVKTDWDASLPTSIINAWQTIYRNLFHLESIQIARRLTTLSMPNQIQLHAFCDASEAAYGSVIYLRAVNEIGEVTTNIVYAKSKVAPIKQISLPRLELCGAVLLCKALKFCIRSLLLENIEIYAWTDSMIVLHWLSDVPRRWKSFIGNRTAAILDTVPRSKWNHIQSKHNPADAISRGVNPHTLTKLSLWWHGPSWLNEPESNWPKSKAELAEPTENSLEERSKYVNLMTEDTIEEDEIEMLLNKISSWFKIRKVVVYILRFGKPDIRKNYLKRQNSLISATELIDAELVILRKVQQVAFKSELKLLSNQTPLNPKHYLASLDPFIDAKGLIRVGGRLNKSSLSYDTKHPVILPKDHIVCEKIIHAIHITHMHAGNSLTLSIVRNQYWMVGARNMIKRSIKSCTVCTRYRICKTTQKMADLPAARCTRSRPFSKVGLDYAGPLSIKSSKRRNAPIEKSYVAVFVCLAVKAVHLEVVSSLDTDSFLAALKRFIARRGIPEQIWCDNGSNFIGANRELQQLQKQIKTQINNSLIFDFVLQKKITFHFNPPHAPHFGGLWEASVKSFKYHLKRVTNINLTFEEMTTLITQIEALLNSRPLCRLTDDPSSLEVLTPAHFLIGESLIMIPEPELEHIREGKLSRWQNIQQRLQGFWKRWHSDYLTTLQQRFKWKSTQPQFAVDDIVLIREDNLHPNQWLRGRITAVHPGSDDIVRVATLKTSNTVIRRPVHKLIKLIIKK